MQIGSRAARMGLEVNDNIFLYSATRLQDVLAEILSMRPRAVIVDSIQTVYLDDVNGSAGSVSQVRRCCLLVCPSPYHLLPIVLPIALPVAAYCSALHLTICCLLLCPSPCPCCLLFCPSSCSLLPIVPFITLPIDAYCSAHHPAIWCLLCRPSACLLLPIVLLITLPFAAYCCAHHSAH